MADPLMRAFSRVFAEAVKTRRYFGLLVDGIEVTQSTQFYRASDHLSDPAVRGADNSIPLIAGKSALVRVYVRSRAGRLDDVTGNLTVERLSWRGPPTVLATLLPRPPGTTTALSDPSYAGERGSLGATLNFRIPANLMGYRLRLTAQVRAADASQSDEMAIEVTAGLRQTLRVRGIAIRYQGPDAAGNPVTLPPPSLADFASTAATALAMFPVEDQPDISLTGDFNWFAPLDGAPAATDPGGCAPSWQALLYWLNLMKSADGNRSDRIYYGLAPAAIPVGFNTGCGGQGGVSAGRVGDTGAFAHECGHVLGFGHSPCGLTPGDPNDPNYPAYQPYDTPAALRASIGEYGVDVRNYAVASPAMTRDFMSYCGPQWIGPYHYRALVGHALLDPRHLVERGPKLPDWVNEQFLPKLDLPRPPGPVELENPLIQFRTRPVQRLMLVTGLMRGGQFEQISVLRLPTRAGTAGTVLPGVAVEVRNAQGVLVDRARLRRAPLFASGCGCGSKHDGFDAEPGFESGLVEALLADRDDVGEVRIVRNETGHEAALLWTRSADDLAPRFEAVSAAVEANELHVQWVIRDASAQTHYIIRVSTDRGADWETLTIMPGTGAVDDDRAFEARLTVAALRPGMALVEVVAVEGLHTVVSDAVDVTIPDRAPTVAIMWPRDGSAVLSGEPVRLWGMAVSASGASLPDDALHWTLDGRDVGRGTVVEGQLGDWEGEHRATLSVHTEQGSAEASVTFLANCSGEMPRLYRR